MTVIDHLLTDRTMDVLRKGMEGTLLRTKVSMNNLANVDTPGFKRQTVRFEDALRRALRGGGVVGEVAHPAHIPIRGSRTVAGVVPQLATDYATSFRADGNNVDVDQEMVAISQAAGKNVQFTTLLSRTYENIRGAIRERV